MDWIKCSQTGRTSSPSRGDASTQFIASIVSKWRSRVPSSPTVCARELEIKTTQYSEQSEMVGRLDGSPGRISCERVPNVYVHVLGQSSSLFSRRSRANSARRPKTKTKRVQRVQQGSSSWHGARNESDEISTRGQSVRAHLQRARGHYRPRSRRLNVNSVPSEAELANYQRSRPRR